MGMISVEFLLVALSLSAFTLLAIGAEKAALDAENEWSLSLKKNEESLSCSAMINRYYANSGGKLSSMQPCGSAAGALLIAETFSEGGRIHVKIKRHYGDK